MARLTALIASVTVLGTVVLAHGGHDHIRGVVTKITDQAIIVQVADKTTKTLTVNAKTVVHLPGHVAVLSDLKVGDRVVVEVPEGTTQADEITIGAAPKPAPKKAP